MPKSINIFGVARSGTKVLQLFITELMLQKENRVRLNYEPYYWVSRKLGVLNFTGMRLHLHEPHFATSKNNFHSSHLTFLENLYADTDISTITKFIRANGRAYAINEWSQVDHSFLIVRSLKDLLPSLEKLKFNLFSVGQKMETSFWSKFIREAKEKGLTQGLPSPLLDSANNQTKNALYWYCTNLDALNNLNDTIVIPYEELANYSNGISKLILGTSIDYNTRQFNGNDIHNDRVIKNLQPLQGAKSSLQKAKFYAWQRFTVPQNIDSFYTQGDLVEKVGQNSFVEFKGKKSTTPDLDPMLEELNIRIMRLAQEKHKKQSSANYA